MKLPENNSRPNDLEIERPSDPEDLADSTEIDALKRTVAADDGIVISEHTSVRTDSPPKGGCGAWNCGQVLVGPLRVLAIAWRTYGRQSTVYASVALALLYMTVLGFDSITTGYIYANGVNELVVGVSMALAGVTGVVGTVAFTWLRKRIGLERTGLFAFNIEITCLILAVASIWAPGTKFDPSYFTSSSSSSSADNDSFFPSATLATFAEEVNQSTDSFNRSVDSVEHGNNNVSTTSPSVGDAGLTFSLNTSVILLLVGIISSRVGEKLPHIICLILPPFNHLGAS